MLFASGAPTGADTVVIYLLAAVISAAVLAAGRWIVKYFKAARAEKIAGKEYMESLTDFLFDAPPDPHSKTPGTIGWTTHVNTTLARIETELHPNGGSSLRDDIQRTRRLAEEAGRRAEEIAAALTAADIVTETAFNRHTAQDHENFKKLQAAVEAIEPRAPSRS